jgi:hypothetical protein
MQDTQVSMLYIATLFACLLPLGGAVTQQEFDCRARQVTLSCGNRPPEPAGPCHVIGAAVHTPGTPLVLG